MSIKHNIEKVSTITDIPFLPISFFKTQIVKTQNFQEQMIFESSSTTGMGVSKHYINTLDKYEKSFNSCFEYFYGRIDQYCFLFLLPSYLERKNSSLVYMADCFIKKSRYIESGFYLYDYENLARQLKSNIQKKIPTILWGVSFALLDFAEKYTLDLSSIIIIETGGMKGRKAEISRNELHYILKKQFNVNSVHSEYGMTELMSQAYAVENGIFRNFESMAVLVREIDNPLSIHQEGRGAINLIDLNNKHSCCFIASEDFGVVYNDNAFEILGRISNSDLRGCNQLL